MINSHKAGNLVYVVYAYEGDTEESSKSLVFSQSPFIYGVYSNLDDAFEVMYGLQVGDEYGHLIWSCDKFYVQ